MRLGPSHALFLDFDGTLAPIQRDADTVAMGPAMERAVLRARDRVGGALCLISGRDLDDLARRAPRDLALIGNHGLRARGLDWDVDTTAPLGLPDGFAELMRDGAYLETKGPVLAIHYREAPHLGPDIWRAAEDLVAGLHDHYAEHGKCVVEIKPVSASKGAALARAMARPPFHGRRPVMIGDDTTDEAAFGAAQALGGVGVKVGGGRTAAHWRVAEPDDVRRLLDDIG